MKTRCWWGWCLCACAAASIGSAGTALGQPRPDSANARAARARDATVVRIDGDDVYLDVGRGAVAVGATFEVLRPIETRHPLTHAVLRDRFPIGRLVVVAVGETLSIARLDGTPHRPLQLADLARAPTPDAEADASTQDADRLTPGATAAAPTAVCPPTPVRECPPPRPADPRAREILGVWGRTFGLLPESRIRVWQAFLASSPNSPYVQYAAAELNDAQRQLARERAQGPTSGVLAEFAPLTRAYEGQPVALAGIIARGVAVQDLSVYVRLRGEPGVFTRVPMVPDAAGHVAIVVPSRFVALAGFEWFAEITLRDGRTAVVAGSPSAPISVDVWASPESPPDESGRSRVRFSTDYVDFNRSRGDDYYVAFEGDFTYRLGLTYFPSVRVGYGHLQGQSGDVTALDELGLPSREVGFTYGFVEPELAPHELFAVALRITAGLGLPQRRADGLRGGVQLRFRIGEALGTHLVLAGETIPELGLRGYIGLAWLPIPDWPMAAEVHVTDQPGNGQIAVRGVLEVGHRFGSAFALATRLSYQGRNIDHSGLGAGLALTFDW